MSRFLRRCCRVSALVLAAFAGAAFAAPAQDQIGIWFDVGATVDTVTTATPGQVVTAYLVLLNPSAPTGLGGWECVVEAQGGGLEEAGWTLNGGSNLDSAPSFQVGYALGQQPLPAPTIVLATGRYVVREPGDMGRFFIHPRNPSSLQEPALSGYLRQAPIYAAAHDPADLRVLTPVSGSEALPVAVINPVPVESMAPEARAYPARLPFGQVELGQTREHTLDIANVGGGVLEGVVPEPTADGFSVVSGSGAYALGPGELRRVTVRFAPTTAGARAEQLAVGAGIELGGSGFAPGLCNVTPEVLDFGSVTTGQESCLQFGFVNRGDAPITGTMVSPSPAFAILDPTYFLPQGEGRVTRVCFAPTDTGNVEVVVDLGNGCGSVICRGHGLPGLAQTPTCGRSHGVLRFGALNVGETKDLSFRMWNAGGGVLSGQVSVPTELYYTVIAGGEPYALAAGETLAVTVRYAPLAPGDHDGTLQTGCNQCGFVILQGGTPGCDVAPDTLDFGPVALNQEVGRTLTVRSTGAAFLAVRPSAVAPPFRVIVGSATLAPGRATTVQVLFKPTSEGPAESVIDFASPCGPVVCRGEGVAGAICDVTPNALDFGSISVGMTRTRTFTFGNRATASRPMAGILALEDPAFHITSGGGAFLLQPGESREVTVSYVPLEAGLHARSVSLGSDACAAVVCGGRASPPVCVVLPDSLTFCSVAGKEVDRVLTVINAGQGDLDLAPSIAEPSLGFGVVRSSCNSGILTPNEGCSITVGFVARSPGSCRTTFLANPRFPDAVCTLKGKGSSVPPHGQTRPSFLHFGPVAVGQERVLSFSLRNVGGGVLTGTVPDSLPEQAFTILSGSGPYSLAAGDSIAIQVRFSPVRRGMIQCGLGAPCGITFNGLGWQPGSNEIGVYFDQEATRTTHRTTRPFEPVTAYLVMKKLDPAWQWIFNWSAAVQVDGACSGIVWQLPAGMSNYEHEAPIFDVYCGLTATPVVLLATVQFMQDDPERPTFIRVGPIPYVADGGAPLFQGAASPDDYDGAGLEWLFPASGNFTNPVAVVNEPLPEEAPVPAPAAVQSTGGVVLSWAGETGATYHVYRGIDDAPLVRLTAEPIVCSGAQVQYRDALGGVSAGARLRYACALWREGAEVARGDETVVVREAAPPVQTVLRPAYPNPFNPLTQIRFELARAGHARLVVFDLAGRRVRELVDEDLPAASHERTWDGRDDRGQPVPSGAYYARLTADGVTEIRKLTLVR